MSSEYVTGTITGVIATLVGFALTMLYEWRKQNHQDELARTKTLELLTHELSDNLEIAQKNHTLFLQNIALMSQGQGQQVILSPTLYHGYGWQIAQANDIYSCVGNETYELLAKTYVALSFSNSFITARESFRFSNIALSSYQQILLDYDKSLELDSNNDVGLLTKAIAEVKKTTKA